MSKSWSLRADLFRTSFSLVGCDLLQSRGRARRFLSWQEQPSPNSKNDIRGLRLEKRMLGAGSVRLRAFGRLAGPERRWCWRFVTRTLRCALRKVSTGDSTDNQTPSNTREGSGHGPYTEGKAPALGCPRSPRRGRSHIHSQALRNQQEEQNYGTH